MEMGKDKVLEWSQIGKSKTIFVTLHKKINPQIILCHSIT
jgi:hypothetical protein